MSDEIPPPLDADHGRPDAAATPTGEAKAPSSTGKKVAIGCGCGCLGLIVLGIIGSVASYLWVMGMVDDFKTEFADMGMKEAPFSQMLVVTEAPTEPTYYVGQVVRIEVDTDVEIGIIAQTAELNGVAREKVYFRGQVLSLNPEADLQKGLDVKCQMVQGLGGTVTGGITGTAQLIQPPSLGNGTEGGSPPTETPR